MARIFSLSAALFLAACHSPAGIWMIKIEAGESTCADDFQHNFLLGYPPEAALPDPSWISTEVSETSPALAFVQIETTGEEQAVMLYGDEAWPGEGAEDKWSFAWTTSATRTITDEHRTGYFYQVYEEKESDDALTLTFDGDAAVGEMSTDAVVVTTWAESDTWSAEVEATVTATGQIPSATYLQADDPVLGTPAPLSNSSTVDDCDGEVCQLGLSTTCATEARITATRTDYDSEEAYRQLSTAGQAAGSL